MLKTYVFDLSKLFLLVVFRLQSVYHNNAESETSTLLEKVNFRNFLFQSLFFYILVPSPIVFSVSSVVSLFLFEASIRKDIKLIQCTQKLVHMAGSNLANINNFPILDGTKCFLLQDKALVKDEEENWLDDRRWSTAESTTPSSKLVNNESTGRLGIEK